MTSPLERLNDSLKTLNDSFSDLEMTIDVEGRGRSKTVVSEAEAWSLPPLVPPLEGARAEQIANAGLAVIKCLRDCFEQDQSSDLAAITASNTAVEHADSKLKPLFSKMLAQKKVIPKNELEEAIKSLRTDAEAIRKNIHFQISEQESEKVIAELEREFEKHTAPKAPEIPKKISDVPNTVKQKIAEWESGSEADKAKITEFMKAMIEQWQSWTNKQITQGMKRAGEQLMKELHDLEKGFTTTNPDTRDLLLHSTPSKISDICQRIEKLSSRS